MPPTALPFPVGGCRLIVYVVYDRRGGVDDFIPHALAGLRDHATRILVVVNGALSDEGRAKLEPVSDEILVRPNVGFDIEAHKDALVHLGASIADFDEVVLTNDTWFGPVRPYGPVFERMGERAVHFWGMTDHPSEEPNPFTHKGVLPYHLQSFWIAVRREMFLSAEWDNYWRELPPLNTYFDAVLKHEVVFTETFAEQGFRHDVAFPFVDYPTGHAALFNPDLLLEAGCPLVKRRPFFHYPPFLDRHAVIGRENLRRIADYGFPMDLIWQNLARNTQPKVLNADAGMLEVLPDIDVSAAGFLVADPQATPAQQLRVVAVAHVRAKDDVGEVLDRLGMIPTPFDLVVTTADESRLDWLRATVASLDAPNATSREVRLLPSKRGRDMSAFFVGCRDLLLSDRYDVVVKVHTRTPAKRSQNVAHYFRRFQTENLLSSAGYIANLLALFQREPGLGAVFAPMMHIGYATPGRGWSIYRDRAVALCSRLGIRVPLDGISPLAPMGGMFAARPAALRLLTEVDWKYGDYANSAQRQERDLARIQERLIPVAAGELGYHVRTVLNLEHAGISHVSLEYKIDQLSATLPGYPVEQIQFLQRAGWSGSGGGRAIFSMYMRMNHPKLTRSLAPALRPARAVARRVAGALRRAKRVMRRLAGRGPKK